MSSLIAVAEARKLRDSLTTKLTSKKINPEDGIVQIVFAVPDLSSLRSVRTVELTTAKDMGLASEFASHLAIGFLVWVWDREEKQIYGHARPLIVSDPRSLDLNSQALAAAKKKLMLSLAADGLIEDFRN